MIWCPNDSRERVAHFIDEAKHTLKGNKLIEGVGGLRILDLSDAGLLEDLEDRVQGAAKKLALAVEDNEREKPGTVGLGNKVFARAVPRRGGRGMGLFNVLADGGMDFNTPT
jgi:hypothetical protein